MRAAAAKRRSTWRCIMRRSTWRRIMGTLGWVNTLLLAERRGPGTHLRAGSTPRGGRNGVFGTLSGRDLPDAVRRRGDRQSTALDELSNEDARPSRRGMLKARRASAGDSARHEKPGSGTASPATHCEA